MSVLELLELQARARAIRSQLAMEPITKIEVKSDDDIDEVPVEKVQRKEKEKRSTKKRIRASANRRNQLDQHLHPSLIAAARSRKRPAKESRSKETIGGLQSRQKRKSNLQHLLLHPKLWLHLTI